MQERSETAVSGDDTAGSPDHNRCVEAVDTLQRRADEIATADRAEDVNRFRDHAEEIRAARDGTHPGYQR